MIYIYLYNIYIFIYIYIAFPIAVFIHAFKGWQYVSTYGRSLHKP